VRRKLIPFEAFSAQSQHLGRFNLTLIQFDRSQAREHLQEDSESALRVEAANLTIEQSEQTILHIDAEGRIVLAQVNIESQRRIRAKAAKATAIEVPSSHVAMLSFPKEVADLIIKAAE
jgi:hypothetical protein